MWIIILLVIAWIVIIIWAARLPEEPESTSKEPTSCDEHPDNPPIEHNHHRWEDEGGPPHPEDTVE